MPSRGRSNGEEGAVKRGLEIPKFKGNILTKYVLTGRYPRAVGAFSSKAKVEPAWRLP
jgi:hypothetical protein